jgi:protein tyrosine phosphatase (PTP) superfamily phosphohydrolase (DUF442 family)
MLPMSASRPPAPLPHQGYFKSLRKGFQAVAREVRLGANGVAERLPDPMRRALAGPVSYADMLLVDHGIFRLVYLNKHRLSAEAYRAAQPAPHNIRRLAGQGVRTIVNLRGERDCGAFRLEQKACAAAGIEMINFKLLSRACPDKETVKSAAKLLNSIAYPMAMHCKSGADRVGLMSVLYSHLRAGEPMEIAKRQLSWRYGHFSAADTGILDAFFDAYIAFNRTQPTPFLEWVDTHYDPVAVRASFKPSSLVTLLTDKLMGRE